MGKKPILKIEINQEAETIAGAERLVALLEENVRVAQKAIDEMKADTKKLHPESHKIVKILNDRIKQKDGNSYLIEMISGNFGTPRHKMEIHERFSSRCFSVESGGDVVYGYKSSTCAHVVTRVRLIAFHELGEIIWENPKFVRNGKERKR